ncbi:MAG: TIGR04255 family protein [Propionicimonas sp.]
MTLDEHGPFGAEVVEEIPLSRAPLALVLAQIRFPVPTVLVSPTAASELAGRFADDYPAFDEQSEFSLLVGPGGVQERPTSQPIWKFTSEDDRWNLSIARTQVTLLTEDYTSREEFLTRFESAWAIFAGYARPHRVDRSGFRYVNQLTESNRVAPLDELIRPALMAGDAVPRASGAELSFSMNQAEFALPGEGGLTARWGSVPTGFVVDPSIQPTTERSWMLDLDAFGGPRPLRGFDARTQIGELAERAYRFFRWATTDRFIKEFGGAS